jgi:hypothetical protein
MILRSNRPCSTDLFYRTSGSHRFLNNLGLAMGLANPIWFAQ